MKKSIKLISLYIFLIYIIYYGVDIIAGVRKGIDISLNLVIPSMFIFIVISNFILASNLKNIISVPFNFITSKLFKINSLETAIFILSLIGGYPVGAKLLANSVNAKYLSPQKASILLSYCVNCGPAFLISGIGGVILGNAQLGIFMYISQIFACLIVGFISSFLLSNNIELQPINSTKSTQTLQTTQTTQTTPTTPTSKLLVTSVIDAVKSLSIICGFVVFFCAISPILINIFSNFIDEVLLNGILEVTAGCNLVTTLNPLQGILYASCFVSFGGICVILQIFAMLLNTGISMKYFFLFKPLYILINVGITYIFLNLFPDTISTFKDFCVTNCYSNGQPFQQNLYSVTPLATIFMIILAILLLFFSTKYDIIEQDFLN